MRILQANKFFYHRGGAEVVFFDTINGLRERGHEVAEFSMSHPKNEPSEYADFFVSALPELTGAPLTARQKAKIFSRNLSSSEVTNKLTALVKKYQPQVAHLHNVTRQLSASIFTTLHKLGVPIVLTVHDVQPMCPNHRMVNGSSVLCEKCLKHKYYNCVLNNCVDNSLLKNLGAMTEAYYYYSRGIWNLVNVFVCPSEFMKNKMAEWGFDAGKIEVVRNPYQLSAQASVSGSTIAYVGRLHEEKGIRIFMKALLLLADHGELRNSTKHWTRGIPPLAATLGRNDKNESCHSERSPANRRGEAEESLFATQDNYEVLIAGDGPEKQWVENFIREKNLTNVKMAGWKTGAELEDIMNQSKVVVVPSLFYENCSLTILEAMSKGKIVIASNRGGNPELVVHEQTGFLAEPENPASFAALIKKAMCLSAEESRAMGERARERVGERHGREEYLEKVEEIYRRVANYPNYSN